MTRKGKSLTISLSQSNREALERLALRFDCLWGDEPSISALIAAIAEGEIELVKTLDDCPTVLAKVDRRAKRKLTATQMQEMRGAGQTLQEISEQAGICREAVRRATKSPV